MSESSSELDTAAVYERRLTTPTLGVLGAVLGLLAASINPAFGLLALIGFLTAAADLYWQRRTPLIVLSSRALQYRPSPFRKPIEVQFSEILTWSGSGKMLAFVTRTQGRLFLPLDPLSPESREDLLRRIATTGSYPQSDQQIPPQALRLRRWLTIAMWLLLWLVLFFLFLIGVSLLR